MNPLTKQTDQTTSSGAEINLSQSRASKQRNSVVVSFPCVHGAAAGQLIKITCFGSNELKGPIKVVAGVDDEAARRIIGATRHEETDERAANGVIALFSNPLFGGASFGLALAIADKMTRFGAYQEQRQIVATGRIPADGCGSVETIGEFEAKLELIEQNVTDTYLFVFPGQNLKGLSKSIQHRLDALEAKGIQWHAINHIQELEGVLWVSRREQATEHNKSNESKPRSHTKGESGNTGLFVQKNMIVGILLGLSILIAILFFTQKTLLNNNVASTDDNKGTPQVSTQVDSVEIGKSGRSGTKQTIEGDGVIESERLDTSAY